MKRILALVTAAISLCLHLDCSAQDAKNASHGDLAQATNTVSSGQQTFSPKEAEARFKALLTGATLTGRWSPIKDGLLGPEKEDKYNIVNVAKVSGDSWIVNARMKYGEREFVAPIPVKVQWAGDTPVLIVDKIGMPGGSTTYSARVLFYEKTYSGTWTGARGGGLLYGVISSGTETNRIERPVNPPAATNQPGS